MSNPKRRSVDYLVWKDGAYFTILEATTDGSLSYSRPECGVAFCCDNYVGDDLPFFLRVA